MGAPQTVNIYDLTKEIPSVLSGGEWSQFLHSAAWNFRFDFLSQAQIYLQRPEAYACYTFEEWNKRFDRRIKAGSRGIAILNSTHGQMELQYLFDYSDTYSRRDQEMQPWSMAPEKERSVKAAIRRQMDVDGTLDYNSSAVAAACPSTTFICAKRVLVA